jgi:hypothetical protein
MNNCALRVIYHKRPQGTLHSVVMRSGIFETDLTWKPGSAARCGMGSSSLALIAALQVGWGGGRGWL